ncbi:MAG: UpxY family transcription antiterminator [Ignavibacteriales bacterium]|nr:UpxY family transcription antiterminator [Ignavibacteriales bacterium]
MNIDNINKNWLAFYTKSNHEKKVAEKISNKNIEVYVPTIILLRRWSDRIKKINVPLFRNYVLLKCSEKERLYAIQTEGVVRCVTFQGKPAIIPNKQIESIKKILEVEREKIEVQNGFLKGEKVIISSGPFVGVEGVIYFNEKNENKIAILVEVLNRSVVVTLPPESAIKVL